MSTTAAKVKHTPSALRPAKFAIEGSDRIPRKLWHVKPMLVGFCGTQGTDGELKSDGSAAWNVLETIAV